MTNGEYIRGLSDEDLATFISRIIDCDVCPAMDYCKVTNYSCKKCLADWLKAERKA